MSSHCRIRQMDAWTTGSLVLFPSQLFSCTMYIICWWEASTRLLISSIRDWFTLHAVWLYLCPGLGLPPNFCHVMFKVSFLLKDSIVHTCNFIIYGILPFNNTGSMHPFCPQVSPLVGHKHAITKRMLSALRQHVSNLIFVIKTIFLEDSYAQMLL